MKNWRELGFLLVLAVIGSGICFWLLLTRDHSEADGSYQEVAATAESKADAVTELTNSMEAESSHVDESVPTGALRGERVLSFSSEEEYLRFLAFLREQGIQPRSQIDPLLSLRLAANDLDAAELNRFDARRSYSFPVQLPLPPSETDPSLLSNLVAFGVPANEIVSSFGAGDGEGVKVAVLDSGLHAHDGLSGVGLSSLDLSGLGVAGLGAEHGTSVTSIIAGSDGIAPQADVLAVRVLDERGLGSSFQVAEGIVAAVDAGADLINLSLGVYQDSAVLRQAVEYAASQGVLLVAAAGNDGYDRLPYPAAYDKVLSVTAIDGAGRQAVFPNQALNIDFAAPGVGVESATGGSQSSLFSGTSAAAPFVTGTLAALMSGPDRLSADAAVEVIRQTLNDAGAPGEDPKYGAGVMDWERIRERGSNDILDVAVAGVFLSEEALPGTTMPIAITVQNRGTAWISEAELESRVEGADSIFHSIGNLGPGQITTRQVFVQIPSEYADKGLRLAARVLTDDPNDDVRLQNNVKAVEFRPR